MEYKNCSVKEFLNQVKKHELKILRDEGLYRHIRLAAPETLNAYFEIITWPGHLCFTGDMGTYVFKRLEDMFSFFRTEIGTFPRINPGYWGEKLQAVDTHVGYKKFDVEAFLENVFEIYEESLDKDTVNEKEFRNKKQQLAEAVFSAHLDSGEPGVFNKTRDWFEEQGLQIDLWEVSCLEYTYHFLWCCYAIQWAIGKYDEVKK